MQFREFAEWITRLSHGTEQYLLFTHPATVAKVNAMTVEAGVDDRFHCFRTEGIATGFMYVVVEHSPGSAIHETVPLEDALTAAVRADLKSQLFEQIARSIENGDPYRVALSPEPAELSATSPLGEFISTEYVQT